MTTQVNVNTTGSSDEVPPPPFQTSGEHRTEFKFNRLFQHYITNNNASNTPTVVRVAAGTAKPTLGDWPTSAGADIIDQGWYYIPYCNPEMQLTARQMDQIRYAGNRFRIKKMGAKIVSAAPMESRVNVPQTVTETQFVGTMQPKLLSLKDTSGALQSIMFDNITDKNVAPAPLTYAENLSSRQTSTNHNGANTLPASFSSGELPKTVIQVVVPSGAATANATFPYRIDLMQTPGVKFLACGESDAIEWNGNGKWYSVNANLQTNATTGTDGVGNKMLLMSAATVETRDARTALGARVSNMLTLVPEESELPPYWLIKVPPLRKSTSGATIINWELWVEYFIDIEVDSNPSLMQWNFKVDNVPRTASTQFWEFTNNWFHIHDNTQDMLMDASQTTQTQATTSKRQRYD